MVFAGAGEIAHLFAEIAAVEFSAAGSGRTDVADGETRVVGHGDERSFAVTGVAGDADLLSVNRLIGFKIIEAAAGSPGPGAERAPIVEFARLALVGEADDAFLKAVAFVGLNAGGDVDGIAPAFREELLLPSRRAGGLLGHFGVELGDALHDFFAEGELEHDGDGSGGFGGSGEGEFDVYGDGGVSGVVYVADEFFGDDGEVAVGFVGGADDFPTHFGRVGGDAAVDFTVEIFEDFGAALFLPVLGGFYGLAVFEDERIGQGRVWAGFGFIVVGEVVGGVGCAICSGADGGDVEEVHEALVVLLSGEVGGICRGVGGLRGLGGELEWYGQHGEERQRTDEEEFGHDQFLRLSD